MMAQLETALRGFGYSIEIPPATETDREYFHVSGGKLGELRALLLISDDTWTAGVMVGAERDIPAEQVQGVLTSFLDLNFQSVWAHVSTASGILDDPLARVFFVETAMFVDEMNQTTVDHCMSTLYAAAAKTSQILLAHDALRPQNQFYKQLFMGKAALKAKA